MLTPLAAPQLHDLATVGGVADQDWFKISVQARRSYEVMIQNSNLDWLLAGATLARVDLVGAVVQGSQPFDNGAYRRTLRWIATQSTTELVRVSGSTAFDATAFYEIVLRETTYFCPRYNNAGSQVSVMIVQRAANERAEACNATATFYDELQAIAGTQDLVIGGSGDVKVYALPAIPGLAGKKGGVEIAHNCGIGGLKAKVVALEPATGFSFDTICSPRDAN